MRRDVFFWFEKADVDEMNDVVRSLHRVNNLEE